MDPVTAATAKAVEAASKPADRALTIIQDTGAYLREVVGDLPKNAVSVLGGDWLGQKRIRNLDAMMRRTEAILRVRDVEPSPNVAAEMLIGAQEESRDELVELWARLLANALDPNLNTVRRSYIYAVKEMDVQDAPILRHFDENRGKTMSSFEMAQTLERRQTEIMVSCNNLSRLLFLEESPREFFALTPLGEEFINACYLEK